MLDRFFAGLGVLRPRAIMQMRKSAENSRKDIQDLTDAVNRLGQDIAALRTSIKEQSSEIATVRMRESQLRAIAERNLESQGCEAQLAAAMQDPGLASHVARAVAEPELRLHPCPYTVVDDLLPDPLYDALIEGLPPAELFADRPVNSQQLTVPFHLAPDDSRRIWQFMADTVVPQMLMPAIVAKFRAPLDDWIRASFAVPDGDPLRLMTLTSSDGRILLRTNGYNIPPHRDPKWGFLTCIFYLARRGDDKRWGTDLYEVDEDSEAVGAAPHWIENKPWRMVDSVKFRRNRALIFLNSTGAHGASIPADADPPMLQRYVYQFRIGPDAASMASLIARLSPERRVLWDGKLKDKRAAAM